MYGTIDYIKYFELQHAEEALQKVPRRYGARPSIPRTISQYEKSRLSTTPYVGGRLFENSFSNTKGFVIFKPGRNG